MYAEEMQNKTTMSCYYIPVGIAMLKTVTSPNAGNHIVGDDVKQFAHLFENQTCNLPYDPAILFLSIYLIEIRLMFPQIPVHACLIIAFFLIKMLATT